MTEHLRAPRFGARVTRRVIGVVALGLVPMVVDLLAAPGTVPRWLTWASSVAGGFAAGFLSIRLLRRFSCPRCGMRMPRHEPTAGAENAPILYACRSCDVVWDTGLRTPTD